MGSGAAGQRTSRCQRWPTRQDPDEHRAGGPGRPSTPPRSDPEIPGTGNLTDDVVANGHEYADSVVFSRYVGGVWTDVTAGEFLDQVSAVAKGLVAVGLEPGDWVALISRTRYEGPVVDYAIWFAGCVTVPVYESRRRSRSRGSCRTPVPGRGGGGATHLTRIAEARSETTSCGTSDRTTTTRSTC